MGHQLGQVILKEVGIPGYIGPGGYPHPQGGQNMQHRAQKNTGEGGSVSHSHSTQMLPEASAGEMGPDHRSSATQNQDNRKAGSLIASAGGSLPSYKKAMGFILCNLFFLPGRKTA